MLALHDSTMNDQTKRDQVDTTRILDSDPEPIIDYPHEPSASLAGACKHLIDILLNLYVYVQLALNERENQSSNGLNIDESTAIDL
jgi:hypothetical protein